MRVIAKKVRFAPQVAEIDNTLESLQNAVGGYLEAVTVGENLVMLCDEEGKLKSNPYNFSLGNDIIVGDVLFVQSNGEDFTDIDAMNAKTVFKFFANTPYTT